jgi:hypothetical protein
MLEPRIVVARIHGPASAVQGTVAYPDSITASSHGDFMSSLFDRKKTSSEGLAKAIVAEFGLVG